MALIRLRFTYVRRLLLAALAALAILLAGASPSRAGTPSNAPAAKNAAYSSSNWSGYFAAAGSGQTFTNISSSWTVPTVLASSLGTTYSCFWVGLDGVSDTTVEQCGVEANVTAQGVTDYYPWYELYPASEVEINSFTVDPGDVVTAQVAFTGVSTYTFTLIDLTDESKDQSYEYTHSFSSSGDARSSAEWIAEAPTVNGEQSTLADYGSVTFSSDQATLAGAQGTVGSLNSNSIEMVQNGATVSTPSNITNGNAFTVTYAIPEPSAWIMWAAGAGSLLPVRRRRLKFPVLRIPGQG